VIHDVAGRIDLVDMGLVVVVEISGMEACAEAADSPAKIGTLPDGEPEGPRCSRILGMGKPVFGGT